MLARIRVTISLHLRQNGAWALTLAYAINAALLRVCVCGANQKLSDCLQEVRIGADLSIQVATRFVG